MNISALLMDNTGSKKVSLGQYLNFNDVLKQKTVTKKGMKRNTILTVVGDAKFNIRDKKKLELASLLLNRWMLFKVSGKSVYVNHVASERANVLYQIVLGEENEWSGIYEFALKGKEVKATGEIVDDKKTLVVESDGNYDVAFFKNDKRKEPFSITRLDFDTDEEFKKALFESNLIDEVDLDIYFKPDKIVKPYIDRVLPRLVLK